MIIKLSFFLIISLFCISITQAQSNQRHSIEIKVVTTGDSISNYSSEIQKYLADELIRLKDVKVDSSNTDFLLVVYFMDLPAKCAGYDFHYRAHFIDNNNRLAPLVETSSIEEGFDSYDNLKNLSGDIVFYLDKYWLHPYSEQ
jgi:hypothetical protein